MTKPMKKPLTSEEIYKSWPKWKRDIQIGKIGAKNNSTTKVVEIKGVCK